MRPGISFRMVRGFTRASLDRTALPMRLPLLLVLAGLLWLARSCWRSACFRDSCSKICTTSGDRVTGLAMTWAVLACAALACAVLACLLGWLLHACCCWSSLGMAEGWNWTCCQGLYGACGRELFSVIIERSSLAADPMAAYLQSSNACWLSSTAYGSGASFSRLADVKQR